MQVHHHRQCKFLFKVFAKEKMQQLHWHDIQRYEVTLITELNQDSPNPSMSWLTQQGELGFPSFIFWPLTLYIANTVCCKLITSKALLLQNFALWNLGTSHPGKSNYRQQRGGKCELSPLWARDSYLPLTSDAHFTLTALLLRVRFV